MAKHVLGFSIVLIFMALVSTGCYYDKEEVLYPPGGCDTAVVKYSDQVSSIISNKCFDCHDNANSAIAGNGYSWEGYANISGYLATSANYFIMSINHEVGSVPMPKDRPKLSECEIRTIEIWIENGYPNN